MPLTNVLLTRDTMVRTNSGLVPLAKLREGDTVISYDGNSVCLDTVKRISAAAVESKAIRVATSNDQTMICLETQPAIGEPVTVLLDSDTEVGDTTIRSWHAKAYNDISFSVQTEEHNVLFVGDKGRIMVSVG